MPMAAATRRATPTPPEPPSHGRYRRAGRNRAGRISADGRGRWKRGAARAIGRDDEVGILHLLRQRRFVYFLRGRNDSNATPEEKQGWRGRARRAAACSSAAECGQARHGAPSAAGCGQVRPGAPSAAECGRVRPSADKRGRVRRSAAWPGPAQPARRHAGDLGCSRRTASPTGGRALRSLTSDGGRRTASPRDATMVFSLRTAGAARHAPRAAGPSRRTVPPG